MTHSHEANQQVVNTARNTMQMFNQSASAPDDLDELGKNNKNMSVFDEKTIADMKDMSSMRMYKCNGYFNNRVFSTCPSYPKFHDTYGEPCQHSPEVDVMDSEK